ncbi:hypothetical protein FRACYDRAFT_258452 [Fragilariopsis cylindrus CCMP1102]|uniref:Uncharacterized protein n=1 Tax=Fragilariopsis cylindrus CCMP1102 TaxID=635003 RepID=A0A1E7EJE1_9STRA|nr:hypothetical protein FRACYDRAFT_258452 [Fragilariopsis cylindrus CCMP1102]|eukprot:OEU05743.1 hypothetical protein FRACYDRAFT_258452 [Fragilariopsis cylindrus CCMP1102]
MTRKSVQGGYCDFPDSAGCALTKLECDDPANFRSSRQMQEGPVMAHGGNCQWQEEVQDTVLGQCSSHRCYDSLNHVMRYRCGSVSPDSEWEGPRPRMHGRHHILWTLRLRNVQVGGCSRLNTNGEKVLFCAVSEDACDDEQSWIKAQEVKTAVGFDCFLCREASPAAIAMPAPTESASNISAAGVTTIIIVSSTVGSLFVLFIVGLVLWRVFRTKRAVKRAAEWRGKEEAPPATAIEVNSNFGSDGDEYGRGDSADMENASILSDDK